MTDWSVSCRILRSAQEDLQTVMQALTSADPGKMEVSHKLLENMVSALSAIESAARQGSALTTRDDLAKFQEQLRRAGVLNQNALTAVERQGGLAALSGNSGGKLEFAA